MRILKWLLLILLGAALLGALGFACYRALRLQPTPVEPSTAALLSVDRAAAADRLARALSFATVAQQDPAALDRAAFTGFIDHLRTSFPRTHEQLRLERVNEFSLLYTWAGTDPGLPPVLLAAHLDVVPVEPATLAGWTQPPFAGRIAEGYVWGRGALDDKGSLLAILESVEALIDLGFAPQRTVLLAFGHDEEIGGQRGAQAIAALLSQRGVKAAFSLDEGGAVTQGFVPGVERPVASVMAGEKGYLSVKLTLKADGGHSSTPPPRSVIGRVARAVERLESQQMPARIIAPIDAMFAGLAPEMDLPARLLIANRDWLGPLVLRVLERSRTTNAMIRTTTAPTIFHAGVKDNVLPAEAEAVVNFRLLPGDSMADVLQHVREVIDDDAIAVEPLEGFNGEAPPASDAGAPPFHSIARTIRDVFPDALVASGLVMGATDNRHYAAVREQGYNFSPMPYTRDDEGRIHGIDERLAVADYMKMIQFYAQLLRNTAGPAAPP